jgi:putative FmdB family regulatory protein
VPLYEYRCKQCGHQFEKIQSFSAPEEKECPVCQGELERLISAPAIQFKGAGWYVTDYAGKGGSKTKGTEPSSDGKPAADGKPTATSSESKPTTSSDGNGTASSTASPGKSE